MKLIINADDFGRSTGVVSGVMRAHRDGIVTSTTLMVNAPATAEAAVAARGVPSLAVGVHLVLTYGRPVSDPKAVPSLVTADGTFCRPSALLAAPLRRDEALTEYRAQYARARDLLGRAPTHLDSHHWVHDHPALEWAIGELAKETGAAARIHDDAQRERMRARGVRTADRFYRDFQHAGRIGVDYLVAALERLAEMGGTTELMCHPAEPDVELLRTSTYAGERATELATLTDPHVRAAVERFGFELTTFAHV